MALRSTLSLRYPIVTLRGSAVWARTIGSLLPEACHVGRRAAVPAAPDGCAYSVVRGSFDPEVLTGKSGGCRLAESWPRTGFAAIACVAASISARIVVWASASAPNGCTRTACADRQDWNR